MDYKVDKEDHDELLNWAKLRNALSHFPPEEYRPSGLTREDLDEFTELACRVFNDLTSQKKLKP